MMNDRPLGRPRGLSPFCGALLACCGLLSVPHAVAQGPSAGELLVVNQGNSTMSLVDPRKGEAFATINEAVPHMIAHETVASPDGRFAYLPLYGDSGVGKPGSDGRTMLVIDLKSNRIVNQVDFGHGVRPHCAVFNPADGLLYVTTELDQSVSIVDPHTLKVVGSVPTGQAESHMLAIAHNGLRAYTANVGPGTVSVLDLKSRKLVTTIPISSTTQRISISSDDSMVFTADQTSPRLAVIDTSTNRIARWIDLPGVGYGTASLHRGGTLLVTLDIAGALAEVDLKTMKVVRQISVGPKPQEVLISPDDRTAYVSLFGGHEVVAIDLATWKVSKTIEVGAKADGMAWAAIKP